MELMSRGQAHDLARQIQKRAGFVTAKIMGQTAYVHALEENAFAIVRVTEGRPDEDPSWKRLEDAGASLHAGKDLAGQDFYTGLTTWDTMCESLIRDGSLVPMFRGGDIDGMDHAERIWKRQPVMDGATGK